MTRIETAVVCGMASVAILVVGLGVAARPNVTAASAAPLPELDACDLARVALPPGRSAGRPLRADEPLWADLVRAGAALPAAQDLRISGVNKNFNFPVWINGTQCATEPKIQVHAYDANTYILRQSLCTNFEGPFIYLLFGQDKVLMQDTGAGASLPLATTVYGVIADWLAANNQASIQLIVTHSHAHGDHVSFDSQFNGQPNTVVVGTSSTAVANFFGINNWPTQVVPYDLGGRVVDIIPIPGHQAAHIALYDRSTRILFTGDTLYPGRLYFPKSAYNTYLASIQRMVNFTNGKPVDWVLGTHIEMTNVAGVDFPFGANQHPNERPLQLERKHLLELRDALLDMNGVPVIDVHDDFIVYPT